MNTSFRDKLKQLSEERQKLILAEADRLEKEYISLKEKIDLEKNIEIRHNN